MFTPRVRFCFICKEQTDDLGTDKAKQTACFCFETRAKLAHGECHWAQRQCGGDPWCSVPEQRETVPSLTPIHSNARHITEMKSAFQTTESSQLHSIDFKFFHLNSSEDVGGNLKKEKKKKQ